MPILEAREISVRFGGHMAVDNVDLDVEAGQITGLIGPNGAGKTTTFNVLTGLQPATTGRVYLGGDDITEVPAHRRARLGMARTFQRLELFGTLSVLDNVLVAAELVPDEGASPVEVASALLERVGLAHLSAQRADSLSTGNARLLELARALAGRPKVILLDEPASGLDSAESERFGDLVQQVVDEHDTAVLLVEHDVGFVMERCHRVVVLNLGQVLADGSPQEVRDDPLVLDAYLGARP